MSTSIDNIIGEITLSVRRGHSIDAIHHLLHIYPIQHTEARTPPRIQIPCVRRCRSFNRGVPGQSILVPDVDCRCLGAGQGSLGREVASLVYALQNAFA